MLATLAAKLAQRPGDAAGWRLLGRSYAALGRWGDASAAYARASALQADDAQALADHADALAMAQGRSALGEPTRLIERALALDPRHPQALMFAATAALERNDLTAARAFTQRAEAAARDPTGSPH